MSKNVLVVGDTSIGPRVSHGGNMKYFESLSDSSLSSDTSLQVVSSLELFDEHIRGVREKVDALVFRYFLNAGDDQIFQNYMGDRAVNEPKYNIQHLINRLYPECSGYDSQETDISDILAKLRGIPTLIYHGDLFPQSIQSRISQKTFDLPNIYVQDDIGRPRDMKMQDCAIENGGKMGDQVLVPWVNHVLD